MKTDVEKTEHEIQQGDKVVFKIDLRGFIAHYEVVCITNGRALIQKTHLWRTDPLNETWQPLDKLEKY